MYGFHKLIVGLPLSIAVLAAAPTPARTNQPEPPELWIASVTTSGPGCADPSATRTELSDDGTRLVLRIPGMDLRHPPGPALQTTDCTITARLHVPEGWQVAPTATTVRGHARLPGSVRVHARVDPLFAGRPLAPLDRALAGPYADDYELREEVPGPIWSGCGGAVLLTLRIKLTLDACDNPDAAAEISKFEPFAGLPTWQWREC